MTENIHDNNPDALALYAAVYRIRRVEAEIEGGWWWEDFFGWGDDA